MIAAAGSAEVRTVSDEQAILAAIAANPDDVRGASDESRKTVMPARSTSSDCSALLGRNRIPRRKLLREHPTDDLDAIVPILEEAEHAPARWVSVSVALFADLRHPERRFPTTAAPHGGGPACREGLRLLG